MRATLARQSVLLPRHKMEIIAELKSIQKSRCKNPRSLHLLLVITYLFVVGAVIVSRQTPGSSLPDYQQTSEKGDFSFLCISR